MLPATGSQEYADERGGYGIATLRRKHVTVRGDLVVFDFPGKGGKRQVGEIRERQVARVVRQLLKRTPHGRELFKYENGQRELVDVRRRHINEYIKEVMGERFSAKDFRTWAGTLICASALARAGAEVVAGKSARRRKIVAAIKETAEQLGNTPAVCRSSYIAPAVLDHFERGRVIERTFGAVEELVEHRHGVLHPSEKAVLGILKRSGASKGSRDR